jgi:hypothetical protein
MHPENLFTAQYRQNGQDDNESSGAGSHSFVNGEQGR